MTPSDLNDLLRRAGALAQSGRHAAAVELADGWAAAHGARPEIHAFAAQCALARQDRPTARERLAAALSLHPSWTEASINLGRLQLSEHAYDAALATFESALTHAPRDPRLLDGRRRALFGLRRYREAVDAEAAWLACAPPDVGAWIDHANNLAARHRYGEAAAAHARAYALDPDHLPSLWLSALLVDFVPDARADLDATADRIDRMLGRFEALPDDDPRLRFHAEALALSATTFGLGLLARDTTSLIVRTARQIARFTRLAIGPAPALTPSRHDRPRVGLVSAHWHRHTVGQLFRCWPLSLDRRRYDVRVFHLDAIADEHTAALTRSIDAFHSGLRSLRDWRDLIAQQQLDLLIHIDIGLDPMAHALASQQLAPRQAVAWGHPQTSGLDGIDVFFGSDALEPADAERHYRERLVRLPGLGIALDPARWTRPATPPEAAPAPISLLCAQAASKLHPGHDAAFARILAALPEAVLTLIPSTYEELCDAVHTRVARAFRAAGADPDRQLRVLTYLPPADYERVLAASSVVLDSFDFSGGATTLDAIAAGRAVVTRRGALMRGNQTAGLLAMMGLDDWICDSEDDYVAAAIRLARDPALRLQRYHDARDRLDRLTAIDFPATLDAALQALLAD